MEDSKPKAKLYPRACKRRVGRFFQRHIRLINDKNDGYAAGTKLMSSIHN